MNLIDFNEILTEVYINTVFQSKNAFLKVF